MAAVLAPAPAMAQTRVAMKLRRFGDRVDLVVSGLGRNPRVISQRRSSSRWFGRLGGSSSSALAAPQELSLPSFGLAAVVLKAGSDKDFELSVRALEGMALPEPVIRADDSRLVVSFRQLPIRTTVLESGRLDLSRPGRVRQPVVAPPMRARASAPPLGDMAVGSMLLNNRSFVKVKGPAVSLTLNNAPAKDALMSLARLGGYGFVYVGESDLNADKVTPARVTMAFRGERFDRALNSVLLAAGLQAKLDGRTLLVGSSVSSKTFGPQMSKVFRLNQVKVDKAAHYLASLGASMSVVNTITTTTGEPSSSGTSQLSNQVSQSTQKTTKVETYGASVGPLIGLTGTTDSRLGTVTLVGDSRLIASAESYLKQLDLRRRQVAVKVQILNVSLNNDQLLDSSFSARMGETFIVSDSGTGHLNFGRVKPGGPTGSGSYGEGVSGAPGTYSSYGSDLNLYQQPDNSYYAYIEAQIIARNAKTLAQPTLLVQEGQQATVETGEDYVVNVERDENGDTGTTSYTYEKETAGLVLELSVDKIDDNGFVTMNVNPSISIPVPASQSPRSDTGGVQIFNLNKRDLKSGSIRLRDGQTLILTGVVSEQQIEEVNKWPILGDLPLLGSLFRSSESTRLKDELVIMVTPRVIDDEQGGVFSYGYRPATKPVTQLMQNSF